jgi:hypothetical protein
MERSRARQVARRDVRRITELFDRRLHALARCSLYVGIATEGARDGHGRYTGVFRNFMHGHRITAPSGRSFHTHLNANRRNHIANDGSGGLVAWLIKPTGLPRATSR